MAKQPKSMDEDIPATPSINLLNRKIGPSPAPRMLTDYEIELLRRSAHEISAVTIKVLRKREGSGSEEWKQQFREIAIYGQYLSSNVSLCCPSLISIVGAVIYKFEVLESLNP